jgi:hypothetical protein
MPPDLSGRLMFIAAFLIGIISGSPHAQLAPW